MLFFALFFTGLLFGAGVTYLLMRVHVKSSDGLSDTFKALAADSLRNSQEQFLQLAESRLKQSEQAAAATLDKKTVAIDEMVRPVKETLLKVDAQLQALEVKREGAYKELMESVKLSHDAHQQLRGETSQLLQALRTPSSRGRWGEIQLRRILEMTGMSLHAKDFSVQHSVTSSDNAVLRPDVIVHLPGERCIIVDSKVPLSSYLDASQTPDEAAKSAAMKSHARQVRDHVKALSSKAYWEQVEGTPEFVVLFMPGDHFLSAALDQDPDLMDFSVGQKIILATPMTLIALLRTVAYGWRQESLHENAKAIGQLGSELYGAIVTMTDHIANLGAKLSGGVDSFNKMIGSLDRNVLSKARKMRDFGAIKDGKMLPEALEPIDLQLRTLTITERGQGEDAA